MASSGSLAAGSTNTVRAATRRPLRAILPASKTSDRRAALIVHLSVPSSTGARDRRVVEVSSTARSRTCRDEEEVAVDVPVRTRRVLGASASRARRGKDGGSSVAAHVLTWDLFVEGGDAPSSLRTISTRDRYHARRVWWPTPWRDTRALSVDEHLRHPLRIGSKTTTGVRIRPVRLVPSRGVDSIRRGPRSATAR